MLLNRAKFRKVGSIMPNIHDFFSLFEELQSKYIRVHQNRCVVVRNRNANCVNCADACTSGAISVVNNEILITLDKCIGCGTCVTACPTCALEAAQPNDAELLFSCLNAAKQAGGEAVIACEQLLDATSGLYDPDKVVRVTCLGRVDESLLLSLVSAGASSISLIQANCVECEHCIGLKTAKLVVDTANTLLDTWGNSLHIVIISQLPDTLLLEENLGYDPLRRSFFTSMAGKAKTVASKTLDSAIRDNLGEQTSIETRYQKVMDDGTLPHFIPDRRERLLDRLAQLGEAKDEVIATRLWGHVTINLEICNACMMCATFCPTAAISKLLEGNTNNVIALEHYPGDCVKCRCCEDICPTNALVLCDDVRALDLLSGNVESFEMSESILKKDPAHSIFNSMRKLINIDQIYER